MLEINDVAAYVTIKAGPLDNVKLQKLLYYSQAWHLAITNAPVFRDRFEAWIDGPVVDKIYQMHKGTSTFSRWAGNPENVDGRVRIIVDAVLSQYGDKSSRELSDLTHDETPWKVTRGTLLPYQRSRRPIPEKVMADYYRASQPLRGRYAADLAAGQVTAAPPVSQVDLDQFHSAINNLLAELSEFPQHDVSDQPYIGNAQFEDCGSSASPRREFTSSRARRAIG
jgi:uncharacterized phage-associated protein